MEIIQCLYILPDKDNVSFYNENERGMFIDFYNFVI